MDESNPLAKGWKTSEARLGLGLFGAYIGAIHGGALKWDAEYSPTLTFGLIVLCGLYIFCRTLLKMAEVWKPKQETQDEPKSNGSTGAVSAR